MAEKSFSKLFEDAQRHDDFWTELATLELAEAVWRRMEALDVSRADLARRLGKSSAYVTRILRGNARLTLATIVKIARALDSEVHLHLTPESVSSRS